jgi:predicted ribosomally synthesized peptide with nif11-like leader
MSIENAKAFYSRITTDEAFRTQLEQAASVEERQQILQASGYEFTPADWEAVKAQFQASNSADSELSEADLQAVSGGVLLPAYGGPQLFDPPFDINDLLS